MARVAAVIWFDSREDYETVKAMAPDWPDFHSTFEEWQQAAMQRVAQSEARGVIAETVIVNPQEFADWCRAGEVDCNSASLGALAALLVRKKGESGARR
jgi:hypothetical protein